MKTKWFVRYERGGVMKKDTKGTMKVMVDENQSVNSLVNMGKYDKTNDAVCSHYFPNPMNPKKEEREMKLFFFNERRGRTTTEQIIAEMDKEGYRPATIHEILALGIAYPDKKDLGTDEYGLCVYAIGSATTAVTGNSSMVFLYWDCYGKYYAKRGLGLEGKENLDKWGYVHLKDASYLGVSK
ncbi:hypothetical protein A2811_00850 [Candidatus Campbellbacteria bacterium RIFCSPHIGHO2_01_FULL_34_10]|uniref:Uncharacterized protein n=1 Tax=Candidatus Campbellbacteria bacterium RIFCSPHIGHO2_01_FULL_34_10 TaxID=1797577 RepID=A0A1F5EPP7_9BACT|nr:MAG: hypothetical protein A2811_00850 [Candidatus Campbellbacteria bacterium RIFCSPHIGHO2_01_FULL_34_10]